MINHAIALDMRKRPGTVPQRVTVRIRADAADHRDLRAEPCRRDGLVAALAARRLRERVARERLARQRQPRRAHDEIHVEAADHRDAAGPRCRAGRHAREPDAAGSR